VWLTGGAGRSAGEGTVWREGGRTGGWAAWATSGGRGMWAREREVEESLGRIRPSREGRGFRFPFSFLFSFP
jgi:hypothetical protein